MLEQSITTLPGIGPSMAKSYARLGVTTIRDLLLAFPFRYEDFRTVRGIADVQAGEVTTVQGTLVSIRSRRSPRKRMMLTEAVVEDGTGSITAVWFHQPYLVKTLKVGDRLSLSGKVDERYGLSIVNPQFESLGRSNSLIHTGRLVPIYSTSGSLTQKGRRNAVQRAMTAATDIEEWIPSELVERYDLLSISEAVPVLHFPSEAEPFERALRRMKFGELLLHQLVHVRARREIQSAMAVAIPMDLDRIKVLIGALPFGLTDAQRKAVFAMLKDLESGRPMHRLLEGDVGAGKTVVAALVADHVAHAGHQVAYLAPTELLATQQAEAVWDTVGEGVTVALLTQSQQAINGEAVLRREVLDAIVDGRVNIVVGTHALFTGDVAIPNLTFVIVDEQHRFGVEQRQRLMKPDHRGQVPHMLSMTATPIPRTLAMALYGDMDVSILDELPPGRGKVETVLLRPGQGKQAYALMIERLAKGEQAYVVCPFIEESDTSEAESVEELLASLKGGPLSKFRIAALHGRMRSKEKDDAMEAFRAGEVDVLVATTVIEVGVNVPNATMIFVEGAERFGLAQLHQLRGRVRRSQKQATCFLHPTSMSGNTKQRLEALVKSDDGFTLAKLDLKLRGEGDRFGTRQSGMPEFEFASLSDHALIAQAKEAATELLESGGFHTHSGLVRELERFEQKTVG